MDEFLIYNFVKTLHIVSVIAWFAGLFYLPRLFVYHCQVEDDSQTAEIFKKMEYKLLRYIMNPAMIATIIFGGWLIYYVGFAQGWLHAKLTLVAVLVWFHHFLAKRRKDFAQGKNQYSEKFYRMINEVPTLLLVLIVALVVIKPF